MTALLSGLLIISVCPSKLSLALKHRSSFGKLILAFFLLLIIEATVLRQRVQATVSAVVTEPNDQVQIHEKVTNGFIHPGIGLTRDILENARKQVLVKKEPWYSGFKALAASVYSSKMVTCRNERGKTGRPDLTTFDNKGVESRLKQDALKAKYQALMYYFTGDEVYRTNAMNIVRVWSQMDSDGYRAYSECYIHASYPVQNLITAAELLRYTSTRNTKLEWTGKDTINFTQNFALPAVNKFLNENGWFMNQNGYALAAAMSGDIFTSNREAYAKRVEWFTVNATAPNKGWSSSIQHLARKVDTDAITGKKIAEPLVQLMEMGRDQAHAGDDAEIFINTARQMNAQGTKVDPVTGVISVAGDAVGPYEFLNDRILAAVNHFCRFMLGYDTPWVPAPYDIAPDGKVRAIYPRIADNYRGRIREFEFWDLYYYYACKKGGNVAEKAPYFYEAFTKRIVNDTDWICIPDGVTGEGARVAPTEQQPTVVEVALRSTQFDANASVKQEGKTAFLRVNATGTGTRIAILSADTDKKLIGLRIRTNGVAEVSMSGFARPWLLPDTRGEWRYVTYTMGGLEHFRDIEYFTVKGFSGTYVDFNSLLRDTGTLTPLSFRGGGGDMDVVVYPGAPVSLDLSATDANGRALPVNSIDKPDGSRLDASTGAFSWSPAMAGHYSFVANATDGRVVAAKRVHIAITPDRDSAVRQVVAACDKDKRYVSATLKRCQALFNKIRTLEPSAKDQEFYPAFMEMQKAFQNLQLLTPLLPDGSMDYSKIVATSNIGECIALLTDGNNDTFPVYFLAKGLNYIFDFGFGYAISASAFAIQGRLNFANRAQDTALFGSNDGKSWTQLTEPITECPVELTRVNVKMDIADKQFRYLKIEKISKKSAGLFEPSELRIYGQRREVW